MIRLFFSDLHRYSVSTAVWNLRFNLAWAICPGERKHIRANKAGPQLPGAYDEAAA